MVSQNYVCFYYTNSIIVKCTLISLLPFLEFYNGSLAMDIVHSVKEANGSMNINDLSQYKTSRSELLHTKFGNFNVLASGSSSGGALLLNALDSIQVR